MAGWQDILDWFGGGRSSGGGAKSTSVSAEDRMQQEADRIAAEERRRYESGLQTATGAFQQAQSALMSEVDPNLLFSKAADQIGARGRAGLENIRSSLAGRRRASSRA